MDLPAALVRMLEVSCVNDSLKNWSVYEERDGSYTFKIRFSPSVSRHIEDSCMPIPTSKSSTVKNVFKRKSQSQIDRDSARNKAFQEKTRPNTRSQTAKQFTEGRAPPIDPESSIESVRHCSLNVESPCFIPTDLVINSTHRELNVISDEADDHIDDYTAEFDDSDSDTQECYGECEKCIKFEISSIRKCHPKCSYIGCAGRNANRSVKYYVCTWCKDREVYACELCLNAGAHFCHRKYLKLCN